MLALSSLSRRVDMPRRSASRRGGSRGRRAGAALARDQLVGDAQHILVVLAGDAVLAVDDDRGRALDAAGEHELLGARELGVDREAVHRVEELLGIGAVLGIELRDL